MEDRRPLQSSLFELPTSLFELRRDKTPRQVAKKRDDRTYPHRYNYNARKILCKFKNFHGTVEGLAVNYQISYSSNLFSRLFVPRPSSLVPRPSSILRHPSSIFPLPSSFVHPPSPIIHLPSSFVPRPSSLVHPPSPIIHRPSSLVLRPSPFVCRFLTFPASQLLSLKPFSYWLFSHREAA